jgi:hypothetical protein
VDFKFLFRDGELSVSKGSGGTELVDSRVWVWIAVDVVLFSDNEDPEISLGCCVPFSGIEWDTTPADFEECDPSSDVNRKYDSSFGFSDSYISSTF